MGRSIRTTKAPAREKEVNFVTHGGLPTCSMFSGEMQENGSREWVDPTNEYLINEMASHYLRAIKKAIPILVSFHPVLLLVVMLLSLKKGSSSQTRCRLENKFMYCAFFHKVF